MNDERTMSDDEQPDVEPEAPAENDEQDVEAHGGGKFVPTPGTTVPVTPPT